jgi:hypothetical protein
VVSPIVAAALCIKPRGLLAPRQAEKIDVLKQSDICLHAVTGDAFPRPAARQ